MKTSLSNLGVFWTLMTFISAVITSIGFYFPYWLRGVIPIYNVDTYFGLFRRCNYLTLAANGSTRLIEECGRYTDFTDIPSLWWQTATILTGVGCGISILIACGAFICCCTTDTTTRNLAIFSSVLQIIAVLCIAAGCIIYPLGWSSLEVKQVCGIQADQYNSDSCSMSWGYYVTIAGCMGLLLCSVLAYFSPNNKGGYQSVTPVV